jgi:hypothetical protein
VSVDLLEHAIAAHGGRERWRSAGEVVARIRSGGFALASRFKRNAFREYEARVFPDQPKTVITPYTADGRRGVFEGDRVRVEEDGHVLAERSDPRAAFRGFRRNLYWDDLDALYFAGYALWNYLTTPFLLRRPDVETREGDPWEEPGGARWRRLEATFPSELPTHSREQVFYFDDSRASTPARLHGRGVRLLGQGRALLLRPSRARRHRLSHAPAGDPAQAFGAAARTTGARLDRD